MKILSRIRDRLRLRKLSAAQKMANEWILEADRLLASLAKEAKQLQKIIAKFESRVAIITLEIEHIEEHIEEHEKALESLRNENEVQANITIPMLTAANKLGLETLDAETAIQVRRQAAMLPSSHNKMDD